MQVIDGQIIYVARLLDAEPTMVHGACAYEGRAGQKHKKE